MTPLVLDCSQRAQISVTASLLSTASKQAPTAVADCTARTAAWKEL
jgi:hypothetical protein